MIGPGSVHGTPKTDEQRLISADDHVLEPPDIWTDRVSRRYREVAPRMVRCRADVVSAVGGRPRIRRSDTGRWADWWCYEDLEVPLLQVSAAAGLEDVDYLPITLDEVRPGCWKPAERLADMDLNSVQASVCFPNTLPRFCGQTFCEAKDKNLAQVCVEAYNDWIIEDWCGGDAHGRLIPVTLVPLWDRALAAAEVLRCAEKGSAAITFAENPSRLGLPSFHDARRYWDPLFAACAETGSVINLHIGSSSVSPTTAPDAPQAVTSALFATNTMGALCDLLVSGVFARFPSLRVSLAEGQIGWMPYTLQRLDMVWAGRGRDSLIGIRLPEPPSHYAKRNIYGCVFDDEVGLTSREQVGMSQIMFEVDYPHSDSTFPNSLAVFDRLVSSARLSPEERYLLQRGNAIRAFGLARYGTTS